LRFGIYGWLNWVFWRRDRNELKISRAHARMDPWHSHSDGTYGTARVAHYREWCGPLWDSFTTVLSLAAQYLLLPEKI